MSEATNCTAVLVHGWGSSPRTWAGIDWPRGWRMLPYTLPGHGVRHDEGPWTIPSAAEDLVRYIRSQVPEGQRVLLIAHSMGGQLTALVNAGHPELVLGEAVIDPAYGGGDSPVKLVAMLEALRRDPHGTMAGFITGAFSPYLSQEDSEVILEDSEATNGIAFADYYESEYLADHSFGLRRDTPSITMRRTRPVLGIYATQARGQMERDVDPAELDVTVSVWEDGHGHFLHREDSARFVDELTQWAGRIHAVARATMAAV